MSLFGFSKAQADKIPRTQTRGGFFRGVIYIYQISSIVRAVKEKWGSVVNWADEKIRESMSDRQRHFNHYAHRMAAFQQAQCPVIDDEESEGEGNEAPMAEEPPAAEAPDVPECDDQEVEA
jgi:hypothetical protein